jgi:16S rRNA (uracil1498-N3)-methyltransferase
MTARHDETWIHAPGCALDQVVTLSPSESTHLVRVLRLRAGITCTLIDGQGGIWEGILETAEAKACVVRIVGRTGSQPAPALGLAQAILKNRGLEDVLDLCAQTPLARLQPLWTEHVQVPRGRDLDHQIERLQAKAIAAAQQSRQAWVCQILPPLTWKEWLASCRSAREQVWICDPSGEEIRAPRHGWVAVGPEGGFSDGEVALARSEGATAVGLGPTRLRALSAGFRALTRLS